MAAEYRPGVYFLPEVLDLALIRDRRLIETGVKLKKLLREVNLNIVGVRFMAGERVYFSNECCKKPSRVQTHERQ